MRTSLLLDCLREGKACTKHFNEISTSDDLTTILTGFHATLRLIAEDAVNGNPKALDTISEPLKSIKLADLSAILKEVPETLRWIAGAAVNNSPKALDAISEPLKSIKLADLSAILKKDPETLRWIAGAAAKGHAKALDAISEQLGRIESTDLLEILKEDQAALCWIAGAAFTDNPKALDAISEQLERIESTDLLEILKKHPEALHWIAGAAVNGNPKALDAISEQLKRIDPEDLLEILKKHPEALHWIAGAAVNGNPKALDAISEPLKSIKLADLSAILKKDPEALHWIAGAAVKGHAKALDAISEQLKRIDPEDLLEILKEDQAALCWIAGAAVNGNPKALDAISEPLKSIKLADLSAILKKDPEALHWIAGAAVKGHAKALDAISEQLKRIDPEDLLEILKEDQAALCWIAGEDQTTLAYIAGAAVNNSPKALDAISEPLKSIKLADLSAILKEVPETLAVIEAAASSGYPKALVAIFSGGEAFDVGFATNTSLLIQLAKEYKELRAPNLVHHLAQKHEDEDFISKQDEEVQKCFFYLSQIEELLVSENKEGENGYRYKANIEKVREFCLAHPDMGNSYTDLKDCYPNLIIDHLISLWNEFYDSENIDKAEVLGEIDDLIVLLRTQDVGYFPYPNDSLKIKHLVSYLCVERDQYFLNPLAPIPLNQDLIEKHFDSYCRNFIGVCAQLPNIAEFYSFSQEEFIKDHLSVMLSKNLTPSSVTGGTIPPPLVKESLDRVYGDSQIFKLLTGGRATVETFKVSLIAIASALPSKPVASPLPSKQVASAFLGKRKSIGTTNILAQVDR